MRPVYYLGLSYLALCAVLLLRSPSSTILVLEHPAPPERIFVDGSGAAWFRSVRPSCNPVEVETVHRFRPPPVTDDGLGYSAACYALANKIEEARAIIRRVPAAEQWRAAGIVFDVAHPVADAGDDRAAGPIMELVVEFWPNHYMALYHAGMSAYVLGKEAAARRYLQDFKTQYDQNDGWTRNATEVLERLGA